MRPSAAKCGVNPRTVFRRLKQPEFRRKVEDTRLDILKRTIAGVCSLGGRAVRPVIYRGRQSWTWKLPDGTVVPEGTAGAERVPLTVKRYSDQLLMFLLRGFRPWRYGDKQDVRVGILGPGIEPATAEGTPRAGGPALSPEALVDYRRALVDAGLSGKRLREAEADMEAGRVPPAASVGSQSSSMPPR
jgi:hypothetical protein